MTPLGERPLFEPVALTLQAVSIARMITPKAIRLFEANAALPLTCPGDHSGGEQCPGCRRWWTLQNNLCDELATPVWRYPCVEDPRTENPYQRGTPAYLS